MISLSGKKILVTGAAGFIGSNLVDRALAAGAEVVGYDNFSTGVWEFLASAQDHAAFKPVDGDMLDSEQLKRAMQGVELVFHFAANADVRSGLDHPGKDFEQNTIATLNLLEAMRTAGTGRIVFASTGSIYGRPTVIPTPENAPFPVQTSLYGASKLACEGLIAAYCEGFDFQAWIFRLVPILGERYTHGHVVDFYSKLLKDSSTLQVLGDGSQRKSYLYVQDCIDGILRALAAATEKINIFNLGTDHYCTVNESVAWITEYLGVQPRLEYSGGGQGWVGDNPFVFLDTARIRALDWQPKWTIREAMERTIGWLVDNQWVLRLRR